MRPYCHQSGGLGLTMHIEIETADGVDHSPALEEHVQRELDRFERRHGERITRIEAFFKDERPGKGGVDKVCRLEVRLAGMDPITVDAIAENVYDAARDAAGKLEKAVDKRIGKQA